MNKPPSNTAEKSQAIHQTSSALKTALMRAPDVSFWLKKQLQSVDDRDILDAYKDAKFLVLYCQTKLKEIEAGAL